MLPRWGGIDSIRRGEFVAELLPAITEPGLARAVAYRLVSAARCLLDEHNLLDKEGQPTRPPLFPLLETAPDLPTGAPHTLLRLRLMSQYLIEGAADGWGPQEPLRLRTFDRIDGTEWVAGEFERLTGLALACLWPWSRFREQTIPLLRAWANTGLGDGSGRWRLHWFDRPFSGRPRHPHLTLWRTSNGTLLEVSGRSRERDLFASFEFAPDGRFGPTEFPDGLVPVATVSQGKFNPDFLLRLERLRAQNGPPPAGAEAAKELAGRAGITTENAAGILYGDEHGLIRSYPRPRPEDPPLPADVIDLLQATRNERPESGSLEWRTLRSRRSWKVGRFRELLMPDDPADLWTTGPNIARAADWWQTLRKEHGE